MLRDLARFQDPYFPKGNVSLQYASACEPRGETEIKLITTEKHYTFSAETEAARDDVSAHS
jgi:sterol 3beta-glucosyltransferase